MKICKVIALMLLVGIAVWLTVGSVYPRSATIVGIEYDNDLYIIEDDAGLVWLFGGVEDFSCGENVAMLMWNKLTPWTILDDVIIDIG